MAGGTGYVALIGLGWLRSKHDQADRAGPERVGVGHWLHPVLSLREPVWLVGARRGWIAFHGSGRCPSGQVRDLRGWRPGRAPDARARASRRRARLRSPRRCLECSSRCRTVCLGGLTPGCPFRPLGKERGGQTTDQSFQIGALTTHPLPPPAYVANSPAAPDPAGSDGKTIRQGALSAQSTRSPSPSRPS